MRRPLPDPSCGMGKETADERVQLRTNARIGVIEPWDRDQDIWLARGAALETFAMRVLHALLPTTSGPSRSYSADSIILDLLAMACPLHSGPMSRVTSG